MIDEHFANGPEILDSNIVLQPNVSSELECKVLCLLETQGVCVNATYQEENRVCYFEMVATSTEVASVTTATSSTTVASITAAVSSTTVASSNTGIGCYT